MAEEFEFKVIDKVVAQGEKRLDTTFRETLADLEKSRTTGLTPEEQADLDKVVEAYKLTRSLVMALVQVKDSIQLRLGH